MNQPAVKLPEPLHKPENPPDEGCATKNKERVLNGGQGQTLTFSTFLVRRGLNAWLEYTC